MTAQMSLNVLKHMCNLCSKNNWLGNLDSNQD